MKKKIQKKIFLVLVIIPIFSIVSSFIINKTIETNNNNLIKTNLSTSALLNDKNNLPTPYSLNGTVVEKLSSFSFMPISDIPWANTKKADNVSAKEISSILVPSNLDAIFHVQIQSFDLTNGTVTFELFQNIKTFVDGKVTSISTQKIPTTSGGNNTNWITPNGLLLTDKYNFSWRTAQEIGSFLQNTDLKPNQLTKEIVVNEMIRVDGDFKLPDLINISITITDISTNSISLYGVAKLIINFSNTNANSWINNTIPSLDNRTIILRGMNNSLNQRSAMIFSQLTNSQNIGNIVIENKDIFGDVLLANENSISNLYPSEFVSLNNGDLSSLINMFQKGTYLQNNTKLVDLNYMGLSISDANFSNITGFSANDISQLGLYNIVSDSNDFDGSLKLIYQYKYYDIISNSIVDYTTSQIFAPNTFKINIDANKSLIFNWKSNSNVQELGSSYEIVNLFNKTMNNANLTTTQKKEFEINYSNNFFNGSNDSYEKKDRDFVISYKGGTKNVNGEYLPVSTNVSDFNQLEVTMTFASWSGNIYTETINGVTTKKDGLKTSIIYSMPTYRYSATVSVNWKTNESMSDLYSQLPSEIAYDISANKIPISRFFTANGITQLQTIILPNDLLGSLNIKIIGMSNSDIITYQNVFVGFNSNNIGKEILQFGWLPQIDLPITITDKGIDKVTNEEIISYVLDNTPLFQNGIISATDLSIKREKDAIYVSVKFDFFNQELAAPGNQVFVTKLVGFKQNLPGNVISEIKKPINLTLIIAISFSSLIGIPLLIFFIILLFKHIRYTKNKNLSESKRNKEK